MKIVELVEKVKTLSMEEIDELVDNGLQIEDIREILVHEDEGLKQELFKNNKLKQLLIKQLNSYILELFTDIKNNPNSFLKNRDKNAPDSVELSDFVKNIVRNYYKYYFKEGMELEITNNTGRNIVSIIRELRYQDSFFQEQYIANNIWEKYSEIIRRLAEDEVEIMPKERALEYNKTFGRFLGYTRPGFNLPEAEAALKIAQREDIDIKEPMALDMLNLEYAKMQSQKVRIPKKDEIFSILLDYNIELRNRGIENKQFYKYSPIKEMQQKIADGSFGKDNILLKEEFAFALKMLQNPEILDSDTNQKLTEILGSADIELDIGDREMALLLGDDGIDEQIIEQFPNIKNAILSQMNEYITEKLKKMMNPKRGLTEEQEMIFENYFKKYFEEGIKSDILNYTGRDFIATIIKLKNKNAFIKDLYTDNKVWNQYINILKELVEKDVESIPVEEAEKYDKTFEQAIGMILMGHNIPEAEAALKIAQREDIDLTKPRALDLFCQNYKNRPDNRIEREDEVFSIALDYDVILRSKGIEKEGQYSPIKEMEQSILDGKFGQNNILSREEFAFAMKMIQNPEIFDKLAHEKLYEILGNPEVQINIGKREIDKLVQDENLYFNISDSFKHFGNQMLKQIDLSIYEILNDISSRQRKITPEEMKKYEIYLKKGFYQRSLDRNSNTPEMLNLFCLAHDLGTPLGNYNMEVLPKDEETVLFLRNQRNKVYNPFFNKIVSKIDYMRFDTEMTAQEFEQYDNMFKEMSYRWDFCSSENAKAMEVLVVKSEELEITSHAVETQIEIYIDRILKKKEVPENSGYYYGAMLEYYVRNINCSAVEINENSAISHLIKAAQKGKLPKDIADTVLEELEERIKQSQIVEIPETDDIEKYMQSVAEIRLQQGRMPRECCDFIIKEAILKNEEITKYKGMLERALEDFAEYELEDAKISGYHVAVLNQPFLNGKNTNGAENDKCKEIILSRQSLENNGVFKLLETTLHEITHAEQDEHIKNSELNRDTYRMLKEQLLRNRSNAYYEDNYFYMYNEIDARKGGYIRRNQVLKRMGLTDSQIMELQTENMADKVAQHCKTMDKAKVKKLGQDIDSVDALFLKLLQQKPELLEKNPALNIEFERKGDTIQKRSITDILKSYEQTLNLITDAKVKEKTSSLYQEIIFNRTPVRDEKMTEELEELLEYKTDNPIVNAYRDKWIKDNFTQEEVMLATTKNFYKKSSEQQKARVQQDMKQVIQKSTSQEISGEGRTD